MTLQVKRRGRPTAVILCAMALLGALLLAACGGQVGAPAAQTGTTVEAFIGDLEANATASGSLVPARSAILNAPAPATVESVLVRPGQAVTAGEPLLVLDTADLELGRRLSELDLRLAETTLADLTAAPTAAELAAAEATLASAQAQLDDLQAGPSAVELASLVAGVRAAESSLASANSQLAQARNTVTTADISAAEAQLAAAQLQLQSAQQANDDLADEATDQTLRTAQQAVATAQAQLNNLRNGQDTAAAQAGVSAANARLASARADYEQQTAGPSAAQLAAAEAQVADARASLAALQDGPTAAQIAAQEAAVAQARLALDDAAAALARATIIAPFDGVVAALNVQAGEVASGPVAELVDLDSLEVVLQVDEIDVGSLSIGQAATITLDSYPDAAISAEVVAISPSAAVNRSSGLVTYDVRLRLGATDLPLLAGMTVNADLVTAEKNGVLLAPNAAIRVNRNNGTYSVNRVVGATTEEVPVVIGLRDANYTEILDGLAAGDQLLIGAVQSIDPLGGGPFGGNNEEGQQ